jgi:molybdenum cofactor synthesis domain-containing protein
MTGAQLPFGTDSVLKQEEVDSEDGQALFKRPAKKGEGVRLQGGDAREGEKVFSRRTILDAEKIGLLVSLGVTEVNVYSPPKVAFFMIGDELVPPGDPLPPGKIWAGNSYMFQALVLKYGALPVDGGIVPDTEESIADAMLSVTDARIILTAGGSGKGVHDLTGRAFESVGGQFLFQGVDIWPGGTLSMGLLNGVPYFLLPGGPRTGSLCFHVFVHEALQVIYPTERGRSLHLRATMLDSLRGRSGVTNYLYVTLLRGEKENLAVRSGKSPSQQGVQALAVIPPEADSVKRGDVVEVILL